MILDTNALSALADGDPAISSSLAQADEIVIPVIVLGEFRYGINQSRHRLRYQAWLAELIGVCRILAVDRLTAGSYAIIRAELKSQGRPIPANDLWIAALARQHRLPILTRDHHFDASPDSAASPGFKPCDKMVPMLTRRALLAALPALPLLAARKRSALIIDGQNNHAWAATTPLLKRYLEETGLFTVSVSTTPPKGGDMQSYRPKFSAHDVVVLNYNGEDWSKETEADFVKYVASGKGLVVVHAANNAFPTWPEFNEMIGLGGWGNRTEKSGPYLRFREGKWVTDTQPGRGGSHGDQHEYIVTLRDPNHPITKGLPPEWLHAKDELYDRLRGPAKNVHILASAFAPKAKRGSDENEPLIMVLPYGKGRVFHTCLGHGVDAMSSVDFIVTYQRGTEWATTGKVTQKLPADFPGKDKVSLRT